MSLQTTTSMLGIGGGLVAVAVVVLTVIQVVFWMFVGWRAMKAHEDIADVLRGRSIQ